MTDFKNKSKGDYMKITIIFIILNIVTIATAFIYGCFVINRLSVKDYKTNKYFLRTTFVGKDEYFLASNPRRVYKWKRHIR